MTPSELIVRAMEFAANKHHEQLRRGPVGSPYFSHVAATGAILGTYGYSPDMVAAGILHDVVEDTDTSIEEIQNMFGVAIGQLVAWVSEDKTLPRKEQREKYLEVIAGAPSEAATISCSDLIANIGTAIMHFEHGVSWREVHNYTDYLYSVYVDYCVRRMAIIESKLGETAPMLLELKSLWSKLLSLQGEFDSSEKAPNELQ